MIGILESEVLISIITEWLHLKNVQFVTCDLAYFFSKLTSFPSPFSDVTCALLLKTLRGISFSKPIKLGLGDIFDSLATVCPN